MQYLLTAEEYQELLRAKADSIKLGQQELQALCTQLANTTPVTREWAPEDQSPWGCILPVQSALRHTTYLGAISKNNGGYCDRCPVKAICPYPNKRWSK